MTQLRSKLMLLLSLITLGWGLCTWLEDGAPWSASESSRAANSRETEPIDVRELITAQAARTSATAQERSTSHDNRRQVELTGGTLAAESTSASTPTWLTGEIE